MRQRFWGFIWLASELSGVGLGRFAPWVLSNMLKEVLNGRLDD
jgi:hypothetical protein